MYDPPDFLYKELRETFRDEISTDELLFNNEIDLNSHLNNEDRELIKVTETIISSVENKLSLNTNVSGNFFNIIDNSQIQITNEINSCLEQNSELFVVQAENLYNYEPTLLDDNTVNQFLLPTASTENNKNIENNEVESLALHSCVMCQEVFTTDADLLDHTIFAHATDPSTVQETITTPSITIDGASSSGNSECEWLVCSLCQRVLSTALETEPIELLCCTDMNGRSGVVSRRLSTMFVCDYCSYLFAEAEALDRHKLSCFPDEDIYYPEQEGTSIDNNARAESSRSCEICGKQWKCEEDLKSHMLECRPPRQRRPYNTGNNNKMWNCGSCNQLFVTARELYRHKRGEDRPAGAPLVAYVCEECDKVLGSMCALHTHKKMHKVTKPGYPCRVCGRRFNQSGHLAIHMRMHTGERPYPCDLCSKAFKVKVERDDHRRTHTGERPFACAACPKTFTAAARLREHARIHTDQRPYKCEICGAAFRRPYARTVHTLIHTGEKPHECDVCGTAFRRSGDMWKHKRTLHGITTN